MEKTEKYGFKKPVQNDFLDVNDISDNMDKIETALTEFDDSGSADGITSFTDMLTKLVTGNKLAVTLRNLKAGLQFVLHTGSIVNNCVTDNAKLPLSAAQGKALQDAITKLNGDLQNYFCVKRASGYIASLAAGDQADSEVIIPTVDGYEAIFWLLVTTGSSYCFSPYCGRYLKGDRVINIRIKNTSTSDIAPITPITDIFYIKTIKW